MTYRAFFSYSREDDRLANWLWGVLDRYRTPKDLIGAEGKLGTIPEKLHRIFRDRADLGSGGHVKEELQAALEESERLIVLCTPASAKSVWVNHEVDTFLTLGREDRIFPVIGAGAPDTGDPETECFPPALRNRGILAADLREIKLPTGRLIGDGREGGRLKLLAGLLGVDLDALARRERRRQRMVVAGLSAAALVFLGVATLAGVQTLAERAQRERADDKTLEAQKNLKLANEKAEAERKAREDAVRFAGERDLKTLEAEANARRATVQQVEAENLAAIAIVEDAVTAVSSGDFVSGGNLSIQALKISAGRNKDAARVLIAALVHVWGIRAARLDNLEDNSTGLGEFITHMNAPTPALDTNVPPFDKIIGYEFPGLALDKRPTFDIDKQFVVAMGIGAAGVPQFWRFPLRNGGVDEASLQVSPRGNPLPEEID
ncbi:MAG: TIR domain-containing protein, partial [Caulobacterales bacterium]